MVFRNKVISLIFLIILSSCADKESLTDEELNKKIDETSKAIISLTSDLSCDSNEQCGAIKYGHKVCGGPVEYKLYSSKNVDISVLTELSEEYYDLTKEYNRRNEVASDCLFVSPPEVICNEICQIQE